MGRRFCNLFSIELTVISILSNGVGQIISLLQSVQSIEFGYSSRRPLPRLEFGFMMSTTCTTGSPVSQDESSRKAVRGVCLGV